MAVFEHDMKWVSRGGNQPAGKEWEAFLTDQRETLATMGKDGWQLASAVPVDYVGTTGTTCGGVILYFRREGNLG